MIRAGLVKVLIGKRALQDPKDPALLDELRLTKRFGVQTAVDHLTWEVPPGMIVGLLGPNGAGKSSLMRTIATLQEADTGEISLDSIPLPPLPTDKPKRVVIVVLVIILLIVVAGIVVSQGSRSEAPTPAPTSER